MTVTLAMLLLVTAGVLLLVAAFGKRVTDRGVDLALIAGALIVFAFAFPSVVIH